MAWRPQIERIDGLTPSVPTDIEFLASEKFTTKRVGITVDASTVGGPDVNGNRIIPKGTAMGRISASGKYGPYSNAAGDGRETAVGFLMEAVNCAWGDVVTGLVIQGSVIAARCSGLDSSAKADLPSFTFQ